MPDLTTAIGTTLDRVDARSVVEILIVACIVYGILLLLRGTTAMALLRGIGALFLVAFVLSTLFQLTMLGWLIRNSLPAMLIVIPVLFQPELRRVLEQVGRGMRRFAGIAAADGGVEHIEVIIRAVRLLSERHYGALIFVERDTGLQEYIEHGIALDAVLSPEILVSVFFPNSPLHDGAIIVRRNRIMATRCILPLTENLLQPHLGMRHRAAIGITERSDAVVIVASEETGRIAVATDGRLMSHLDEPALRTTLFSLLGPRRSARPLRPTLWGLPRPRPLDPESRREPAARPAERNAP